MAEFTFNRIGSLVGTPAAVNGVIDQVEEAFDEVLSKVDGTGNQMEVLLDMNSNEIINLPEPTTNTEPLRKGDIDTLIIPEIAADLLAEVLAEAQEFIDTELGKGLPNGVASLGPDGLLELDQTHVYSVNGIELIPEGNIDITSSDLSDGSNLANVVATNNDLIASDIATFPNGVWRLSYSSGVGYPLFFKPQSGTAASNSLVNDGGTCVDNSFGDSWVAVYNGDVSADQFGAVGNTTVDTYGFYSSGTDDTVALQAWLDAPYSFGQKRLPAKKFAFTNLTLPDYTILNKFWSFDGPLTIVGLQNQSFLIQMPTATTGYAIKHPHIGSTSTSRGQHYGVSIEGITLVGTGDITLPMHGWGIENTTNLTFEKNWTYGFPAGSCLHLYAHVDGGSFGANIHNNLWGRAISIIAGGSGWIDLDVLTRVSSEYPIWLDGPYNTTGKCNDVSITKNRFLDPLIGSVRAVGHGTITSNGSSYNLVMKDNVHVIQGPKKLEEGTFSAVTSTSVMTLTNSVNAVNRDTDDYKYCVLAILDTDGQIVEARTITAMTSLGEVTVDAPFTTLPTTSDDYRVSFAKQTWEIAPEVELNSSNASFQYKALYHGIFLDQVDTQFVFDDYFEEGQVAVLVTPDTDTNARIYGTIVVSTGIAFRALDDSDWLPREASWSSIRGSYRLRADAIKSGHVIRNDVQNFFNPSGDLYCMVNDTGATLNVGDVVRLGTGGVLKDSSTSTYPHFVVSTRGLITEFKNGELTPVAIRGIADINVDLTASGGSVAMDQVLIPTTGNVCIAVSSVGVNPAAVIGRPMQTASGSGTTTITAFVGTLCG